MTRAPLDRLVSERAWTEQVIGLARTCGWTCYHTWDARRSEPGWPDWVLARPPRLLFVELKRETGRLTRAQQWWLNTLRACG